MVILSILLAILAALGIILLARSLGVVYVGWTRGGWTIVHEDTQVCSQLIRVLNVSGTYQSATYLDDRWASPVFRYHWFFDHAFDLRKSDCEPWTVAVLGGGGYAIPKHLVAHHPEVSRIDVVEIDPRIERLARRFFFLDRLERVYHAEADGRLHLHLDEAYAWLHRSERTFDVIMNDCFCALEPEAQLLSDEAAHLLHSRLNEGGIYLTNVISALAGDESDLLYATIGTLRQAFSHVWVFPCSPNDPEQRDNNVVVATDDPHRFRDAWEWPPAGLEEP